MLPALFLPPGFRLACTGICIASTVGCLCMWNCVLHLLNARADINVEHVEHEGIDSYSRFSAYFFVRVVSICCFVLSFRLQCLCAPSFLACTMTHTFALQWPQCCSRRHCGILRDDPLSQISANAQRVKRRNLNHLPRRSERNIRRARFYSGPMMTDLDVHK